MLKAVVSYSKKIPVPDSEYSSQGYSLSLETEIAERDPEQIQARLHETFELVKTQVEQELDKAGSSPATPTAVIKPVVTEKASNKQIKYLTDLAQQKGISLSELNATIRKQCGVTGLYDLSRKQCSDMLDSLNGRRKAA